MQFSGDLVLEIAETTNVHKFDFMCNDITISVLMIGSKFTYKRTPNSDLPTVTAIFKEVDR